MAKYIINGPCENFGGNVKISGSKNSALPIMAAALLSEEESVLDNVPHLSDTDVMAEIIKGLGCDIYRDKHGSMRISANITKPKRLRD